MISLLLPVCNESHYIRASLDAVFQQQDRPLFEVIVADGMSTDGTREIVAEYQKERPNLVLIDNRGQIVPTGLNLAIRQARGEIIIRVDGHTLIAPDYVHQCVKTLERTGADNAGGRMDAVGITPFGQAVAVGTSTPFGVGGSRFHYSERETLVDSVYMGAWRRDLFAKIGLFDEELVRDQDDEFNYRIREQGGRIVLNPQIKSHYTVRSDPRALWKQYFQYGFWKVRVLQKHPRQMSLRHFVPPAFAAALIASILLLPWYWPPLALVGGSYLAANLGASVFTAARRGWKHLSLLPLTFFILHFSYGLGFLVGLVKFANRWQDKQGKVPPLILSNAKRS